MWRRRAQFQNAWSVGCKVFAIRSEMKSFLALLGRISLSLSLGFGDTESAGGRDLRMVPKQHLVMVLFMERYKPVKLSCAPSLPGARQSRWHEAAPAETSERNSETAFPAAPSGPSAASLYAVGSPQYWAGRKLTASSLVQLTCHDTV